MHTTSADVGSSARGDGSCSCALEAYQSHIPTAAVWRALPHTVLRKLRALNVLQISHGETFLSETDTEVIPKLCKYVYNNLTEHVTLSQVRI